MKQNVLCRHCKARLNLFFAEILLPKGPQNYHISPMQNLPDSSCPHKPITVTAALVTFYFQQLFLCLPTATLNGGLNDAQTGDRRVPKEI